MRLADFKEALTKNEIDIQLLIICLNVVSDTRFDTIFIRHKYYF